VRAFQDPFEGERPEPGPAIEPAVEHKVVRRADARLASGSFACPCCDLPVLPGAAVSITETVHCPFCNESRSARQFLRLDAVDTAHNRVHVRARLP
jgi:hypothetical protein